MDSNSPTQNERLIVGWFDANSRFGPSLSLSRWDRMTRALRLDRVPPINLIRTLLRHPDLAAHVPRERGYCV